MSINRQRGITAALFATACVVLFAHLGGYTLWDPDEGRHSEIARELWNATTWRGRLLPAHNFAPYYDKPILYYWLTGAAFATFGPSETSARLVSALAALATLACLYHWVAARWDRPTARLGAVILLSSIGFFGLGRYGSLDMLLTCCLTTGLVAAERFTAAPEERGGCGALAAVAAGFGMLAKGLVAPLFIGAIPLLHALVTRRRLPRPRALAGPALVFLVIAVPWYAVATVLDPAYVRDLFLVHHFARFLRDTTEFHAGPWWYYAPALGVLFCPWSFFVPAAVQSALRERDSAALYCLVWAAVVLGFFSCSHGKLATYALPALPPLAVLTARAVLAGRGRLLAGGLACLVIALVVAPPFPWLWRKYIPGAFLAMAPLLALLPVAALVIFAVWRYAGVARATTALASVALAASLGFYAWVAPRVSRYASEAALAATIDTQPPAPVVAYRVHPSSILFYLGRPVIRVWHPWALRGALTEHPFTWVVTSPRHLAEVTEAAPAYPWQTGAHHVLYATSPPPAGASHPADGAHDRS